MADDDIDKSEEAEISGGEDTSDDSNAPGCGRWIFLTGGLLLGGGVYLLNRWDAINGAGKAGAVILVLLGTLILLPFAIWFAIRIWLKVFMGKITKELKGAMEELSKAGGDMVAGNKAMYGTIHEFRPASDEDFESLDPQLYEDAQDHLEKLGYRHLGDVVDQTIEETNGMTTVLRVMSSTEGSVAAGVYHFKPPAMPRGFEGKDMVMLDLSTEFSDGSFLLTANTKGLDLTTTATGLHRIRLELDTPIEQLVAAHETEKQKLLAAKQGVSVVTIHTLSDALESEKRQQAVKNAFRKQIGFVDPEEVRRIGHRVDDSGLIGDAAANAAEQARKKERERQDRN